MDRDIGSGYLSAMSMGCRQMWQVLLSLAMRAVSITGSPLGAPFMRARRRW